MKSKIKNDKNWKEVLKEFEKIFSEQKKGTVVETNGLALEGHQCLVIQVTTLKV